MALYRRGTASMDADGTVHGIGTKWKDQLALIRVGATIVFLEQPIKLAVISDIVSDTEMKAISTDGQTAANGKYVILLSDSLTVTGLAQNVAETLRYYQSKETEIAEAVDLIKNLDMDNINQIVSEIKQYKVDAETAKNQAGIYKNNAAVSAAAAETTKNQTQQILDGALGSINSAKDQAVTAVNSTKDSAVTTINQEEASAISAINAAKGDLSGYVNDAQSAASAATSAKNDAQAARTEAVSAKDAASASAQEAKDAADSIDAENLLNKSNNLSDVANVLTARSNLYIDRISQESDRTLIFAENKQNHIQVVNGGEWGCIDQGGNSVPLSLSYGGVGARNYRDACLNIRAMSSDVVESQLHKPVIPAGIVYSGDNTEGGGPDGRPFTYSSILHIPEGESGNWSQMAFSIISRSAPKVRTRSNNPESITSWDTFVVLNRNATIDGNGFYKSASPIVKLKGDGSCDCNDEAEGVKTTREGVGVYRVSGVLGYNSSPDWGGIDGGIVVPQNSNGLPLLWVDSKVDPNGDIIIYTYHREHKGAPEFASNKIDGFNDSDPIDIPHGRWIDIRVEMPEDSIYNRRQRDIEEEYKKTL